MNFTNCGTGILPVLHVAWLERSHPQANLRIKPILFLGFTCFMFSDR
ncbi:MAG: hypothetical protein F6K47_08635 [Symploca sp. SIO2E6]|nr:hypothetical protein [Symploca sp. SIO2E6]